MPRRERLEKPRRFEWKVIKIPYSVAHFYIAIFILIGTGLILYHYRSRLPVGRWPLPVSVRIILSKVGLVSPPPLSEQGGGREVMERRFATLAYMTGEVKVQRAREMNWLPAETKMKLETGDRVRTFGGARTEVLFDDGSILKIKPDSLIIIGDLMENTRTKVRQSSVKLMVSSIEADIKKSVVEGSRFRLEMPSAVAEMGRAKVSVEVGPGKDSKLKVYAGQVAVDTGRKRVAVGELSQVSIGAGKEVSDPSRIIPQPRMTAPKNLARFVWNDQAKVSCLMQWQPVNKASGYHLQVAADRRFNETEIDRTGVLAAEYRVTNLPAGVWFARVSAIDDSGQEGSFAEPVVFMVVLDKAPPEVTVQKFVSSKAAGGFDIYVEGSTEPTAEIRLAGRPMVVDEQGRFSASLRGVPIREIVMTARDQAGNQTIIPLKVGGGG